MKKQMLTILSLLALACSIPSDARAGAPAAKDVIPAECRASFVKDRGIEKRESTHGGPPQTPASERVAESEKLHLKARRLRKKAQKELAEARHELRAELGKLLKDPVMARGETSVYVVDAYSGRPLFAHHENVPLNPASNVKLVATAASLDAFGSRWRYETFFAGTRSLEKDAVHGDLYLVGSWDPTLKVNHLEKLVEELSLKGVDTISGDLVLTPGGLVRKGEAFELELAFLGKPSKRRIRSKKAAKDADPLAQVLFSEELPFLMIDSRVRVAQVSKTHLAVKVEVLSGGGGNTLNRENGAPLARVRRSLADYPLPLHRARGGSARHGGPSPEAAQDARTGSGRRGCGRKARVERRCGGVSALHTGHGPGPKRGRRSPAPEPPPRWPPRLPAPKETRYPPARRVFSYGRSPPTSERAAARRAFARPH